MYKSIPLNVFPLLSDDDDLEAWEQIENSPLDYSNIDFMMNLAASHEKEWRIEEQYYIQKNSEGSYQNELDFPILKFLIRIIENLNKETTPTKQSERIAIKSID